MKRLTLSVICIFFFCASYAQQYTIKGTIKDTLNNNPLPYAAVTLIRASDSILETYTRTKDDGSFQLGTDSVGKYIILITFPGFANYVDEVTIKDKAVNDIGMIPMLTRTQLMKEVVFTKERAAIKIKGDTIEYVADSFKTRDNATVEELLKKLPGLEVDRKGQVTAQGEQVKKILIDGEEFFSDDPAMVTKSLQASIVDKVQVFNKKSDQAEFTGIDDGQKIKTINLELKDKAKKGYLGRAEVGGGTNQFYQTSAMLSAFRNKSQFAIFGIVSNTNQVGLGWNEREKFNLNSANTSISDDGSTTYYYSNSSDGFDSWDGSYNGQGFPNIWTGGAHYSNKWNNDASHIQGDYRFARQNVEAVSNTLTQYAMPNDSVYYTHESKTQFSTTDKHTGNGYYEWKPDTLTSVKLSVDGGTRTSYTSSIYDFSTLTKYGDEANNNTRTITNNTQSQYVNAGLLYRRKFAKKGRTLSAEFKENLNVSTNDGVLNSVSNYYLQDSVTHLPVDSVANVNQAKTGKTNALAFSGKVTYTEPLSKVCFLVLNYNASVHNNTAKNYSYDRPVGHTAYDSLNYLYSSDYVYNVVNNSGGADVNLNYEKIRLSFGGDLANTHYLQTDQLHAGGDTTYNYSYVNIFPRASLTYRITKQKYLSFNYSGRTQQPTIEQIQPLRQNTDPNNVAVGNPSLKQQFNNSFSVYYNNYKILKRQSLWVNGSVNFVTDAISQSIVTKGTVRTYQYINTSGSYNASLYGGYGFMIKKLDLHMYISGNTSLSRSTQYVNNVENISNNNSYGMSLSFQYEKEDKFSVSWRPHLSYYDNHSTISTYSTSYWQSNNNIEGNVYLPHKFEIGTEIDWQVRQQTTVFDKNNNVLLWNAYVSKKFLKSNQLELKLYVYDILDKNKGYDRIAQENYVQENTYNTIARFGMLSLIWNFSKTGGAATSGGGTRVIKM